MTTEPLDASQLDISAAVPLQAILDGPQGGMPVILLTGLGQQAIDWPGPLIDLLLTAGCRVIRPDHRDAGLSPLCGEAVLADLTPGDFPTAAPLSQPASYHLQDMAVDVLALMDRLDLPAVHLIGYSMGGMIAQLVAALAPRRVVSLTSLMSSTGQPWIDCQDDAWMAMAGSICAIAEIDERIRRYRRDALVFAGPAYPLDEVALQAHAVTALARSYRPAGIWRQARAIRDTGDRRHLLARIPAPTLLVHGTADTCIAPHQARAGQSLIRNSRMLLIPEAGHDLHPALIPLIAPELRRQLQVSQIP